MRYSDGFYERLFTDGHYTVVGCTVPDGEIVAVASVRIVQRGDDAPPAQRNLCEAVQQSAGVAGRRGTSTALWGAALWGAALWGAALWM